MKLQIFRLFGLLPFAGFTLVLSTEISGHEGSHDFSLPIEQIEHVETFEAIRLYGRLSAYHPDAKEHFRDALLKRGDVEDFFRKRLEELPETPYNGQTRFMYFRLLSSLRTPWAARLCGEQLLINTKIELPEFKNEKEAKDFFFEAGNTTTTNSGYALIALERMNIATAPRQADMLKRSGGKTYEELWQEWWRENQANIENLLAGDGTSSRPEKDQSKSDERYSTDFQNPHSRGGNVESKGHLNNEPVETASASSLWQLILGIALSLVAVTAWLILKTRQASSGSLPPQ